MPQLDRKPTASWSPIRRKSRSAYSEWSVSLCFCHRLDWDLCVSCDLCVYPQKIQNRKLSCSSLLIGRFKCASAISSVIWSMFVFHCHRSSNQDIMTGGTDSLRCYGFFNRHRGNSQTQHNTCNEHVSCLWIDLNCFTSSLKTFSIPYAFISLILGIAYNLHRTFSERYKHAIINWQLVQAGTQPSPKTCWDKTCLTVKYRMTAVHNHSEKVCRLDFAAQFFQRCTGGEGDAQPAIVENNSNKKGNSKEWRERIKHSPS